MAEASGSRTHRRQENLPPDGFEDRDGHRTTCASVVLSQRNNASMLAVPRVRCIGLKESARRSTVLLIEALCAVEL